VALIIVEADYMTDRAWEYMKADYYRRMKRKHAAVHVSKIPKFEQGKCDNQPMFRAQHEDGTDCHYVLGWFFVPSYMLELRSQMVPVSALDAAHMYHPAQGTIYVEATQDMLKRLHPVAIMAFLGGENWAGYRLMMEQALAAYGSPDKLDPAGANGVVIGDGAVSLRQQFECGKDGTPPLRQVAFASCTLHRAKTMGPQCAAIFNTLRRMPPSQLAQVTTFARHITRFPPLPPPLHPRPDAHRLTP
jgi:hypothetical protein